MRPNLEFADANPGPEGPKIYHFATGDMPVVLGAAHLASPPDSWTQRPKVEQKALPGYQYELWRRDGKHKEQSQQQLE